jgi:cytochrome c oxidase subunit 4
MSSVSFKTTLVTGAVLIGLWIVSWALSGVELGAWSLVIALGIAVLKAALVVLFFMEIVTEKASVRVAITAGAGMVALMLGFMILDVRTRSPAPREPAMSVNGR